MALHQFIEYVQFQGVSRMSNIIKKWTRDKDSHSAVVDREVDNDKILIEQWPHDGGIKSWMDYNNFSGHTPGTPYEIWSFKVSREDYAWIMNYYRESAKKHKPYDWSGIMAFGLKGSDDPYKTFCSEEMITPLSIRMGWDRIKPEVVHPGYFRNILQSAGAKLTYTGIV